MTEFIRKITFWLFALVIISAGISNANAQVDSLIGVLSRADSDSIRIKCYLELSRHYAVTKQADSSLLYAEKGLELSKKTEIIPDIDFYMIMMKMLDHKGEYKKSVQLLPLVIDILKESKDPLDKARLTNFNGWLNLRSGNFSDAISDFEMTITQAAATGQKEVEADANLGLARVYYNLRDFKLEESYYEKYLKLVDWEKERVNVYSILTRLGDVKRENGNNEEGIAVYMQLADFASKSGDTLVMANALNRASWGHYEMGRLEESLELYLKDLSLSRELGNKNLIANCLGNIGNIYRDWNYFEKAIEYYTLSIEVAKEIHDVYNLAWLYEDISRMYANMGRYEMAYENFVLHAAYNDTLQSESYRRELLQAQAKYEVEKSERELELLQVRLQRNNYLIYGMSGLSLLVVVIALLFIRTNKLRSRERLEAMNHKVSDLTQKNLRSQMNPHFIFNTLNSIQYYVFQNDRIASNDYMTKFAKLIRKTLENSEHPAIPIYEEIDALRLYLELESLRFKQKFTWTIDIDEDIDTYMYKIPTMLIQPFVENSIGHGLMHKNGTGNILVRMKLGKDCINCSIEDNGIGRQKAMEIKNNKNENHVSLGTSITESRLKLVNSLYGKNMKVTYTDLHDKDGNASGTRVEICIPIIT
ncbi:MAG TPA: histidine kinase [Bacteroidales bacterium]|nr:histidine kinase [Bacteroidales bacterium]